MGTDVKFGFAIDVVNVNDIGTTDFTDAGTLGGNTTEGYLALYGYGGPDLVDSWDHDKEAAIAFGFGNASDIQTAWYWRLDRGDSQNTSTQKCGLKTTTGDVYVTPQSNISNSTHNGDVTALIANGVTVNPTKGGDMRLGFALFQGADIAVFRGRSVGLTETAGAATTITHNLNSTNICGIISIRDNGNGGQGSYAFFTYDGTTVTMRSVSQSNTYNSAAMEFSGRVDEDCVAQFGNVVTTTTTWKYDVRNFTANAFDIHCINAGTAGDVTMSYMLEVWDLGDTIEPRCGTIDSPNSAASDWEVSGIGVDPECLFLHGTMFPAVNTEYLQQTAASVYSFGMQNASESYCVGIGSEHGNVAAAGVTRRSVNDMVLLAERLTSSTVTEHYRVGRPTLQADGWKTNAADIDAASATTHKWIYLTWGEPSAAPPASTFVPKTTYVM